MRHDTQFMDSFSLLWHSYARIVFHVKIRKKQNLEPDQKSISEVITSGLKMLSLCSSETSASTDESTLCQNSDKERHRTKGRILYKNQSLQHEDIKEEGTLFLLKS